MDALLELGPDDPTPLACPLPLPFANGVAVLGEANAAAAASFFFFNEGPATGLISGDGRTLLALASAVYCDSCESWTTL